MSSRFATLDSLRKKEEEDESNEYYAGGAGNQGGSGLNVIGGPGATNENPVNRIIERARGGAEDAGESLSPSEHSATVTFYENGFTVNDGPLREPNEPNNQQFLKSISDGYCPAELVVDGKPSDVRLIDKRGEKYTPPPPPQYVAFSGDGQSIGGAGAAGNTIAPIEGVALPELNESEPTIRIQIRFAHNNKRQIAKFNKTHKVQDLLVVISNSEHLGSPQPFQLVNNATSPPSKITSEDSSSLLVDMGLAGGVVLVKL